MPEGPIFSDAPIDSPVTPCRVAGKKAGAWDMPCLLKILCAKDKAVIDHVSKHTKLYKVEKVYFDDNYFDGSKWVVKRFDAGGMQSAGEITMLSGDSCERAATTLYHETWHAKQPAGMKWPHPAEDDAYYNTELWTIAQGLDGQQGPRLRTTDAEGKTVPDVTAISKFVGEEYPVQRTATSDWRISGIDTANNLTNWRNWRTGEDLWKASIAGDTRAGDPQTIGKTLVPAKAIKCP